VSLVLKIIWVIVDLNMQINCSIKAFVQRVQITEFSYSISRKIVNKNLLFTINMVAT